MKIDKSIFNPFIDGEKNLRFVFLSQFIVYFGRIRFPWLWVVSEILLLLVFVWVSILIWSRIIINNEEPVIHRRMDSDIGGYVFLFVWGYITISSKISDYIFLVISILILLILLSISIYDWYLSRDFFSRSVYYLLIAVFVFNTVRGIIINYYGVPEIGHFFEKNRYSTKINVIISDGIKNKEYNVLADVCVDNSTDIDTEEGGGRYGEDVTHYSTTKYINIKRLCFANSEWIDVSQDELICYGDSGIIFDSYGRRWYVKVVKKWSLMDIFTLN